MRTMHPVLKRGGLFWDRDLLPPAAYDARFGRIQAKVAQSGDDAWLVYGDVERYGSLAYFSHFLPRTRSALAFVPREGAPTLLVSVGARDVPAAKTLTWVDDVRPFARLPRTLVGLIEEKGLAAGRLGLVSVEELLPIKEWSEIAGALPQIQTRNRTAELAALRAQKDAHELQAIRQAARVVESGLAAFAAALKPGVVMRAAAAQCERAIRSAAAEDVRLMAASGEQAGQALRPVDDRVLRAGDVVMLYVAAETQRYWAEAARTFVLGRASDSLRRLALQGTAALAVLRDVAKPGTQAGAAAIAAQNVLGDPAFRKSALAYGFGNGVGLDAEEAPMIAPGAAGVIEDHSALAIRAIGHFGSLGYAAAETILVVDGKVERLIEPAELIEIS
jgi:Xaa-Pro aminopeptidase